jgi:hypothetical protein
LGDLAALTKDKPLPLTSGSTTSSDVPLSSTVSSLADVLSGASGPRGIDEAAADFILSRVKQSQNTNLFPMSSTSSSPRLQPYGEELESHDPLYGGLGAGRRDSEVERERDRETFGESSTSGTSGTESSTEELRARIAGMSLGSRDRAPDSGSSFESGSTPVTSSVGSTLPGLALGSGFPPPSQTLFPSTMGMPFPSVGMGSLGAPRSRLGGGFGGQGPRPTGENGVGPLGGGGPSPMTQVYPPFRNLSTPSPMMAVMGYGHLQHTPRLGPETISPSLSASLSSLSLQDRRPGPPSGTPIGSLGIGSSMNGLQDFRGLPSTAYGLNGGGFGRGRPVWTDPRSEQQSFQPSFRGGGARSPRGGGRHPGSQRSQGGKGRRSQGGTNTGGSGPSSGSGTGGTGDFKSGVSGSGGSTGPVDSSSRSAWLDDFRLNKANSNLTLKDVVSRGLMLELATDQYGSRFIQQRLENATPEEKQAAFEQLLPDTLRLCTDVFGNYVIQKFFEFGIFEHKKILASKLVGNVLGLSLQMYGCRVVQKAIDVSDVETQALLVRELTGHVMEFVKDQNGNHVIQKCIEKVPPYLIQFIVEAFSHQIFNLSTHPYGCRVIQRLLENCSESQRNAILAEILENVEDLCKNQYGNYVIQHVLIHGTPWHRGAIIRAVRGKILPLSKHKFASNVIEKCFAHASRQHRAVLVEEVLGKEDRDPSKTPLISMVKDQYANYVIQKMVDVVDEEQRNMILHRIKRHVPNLRKIPYGKHIIARIEKLTGKPILP